MSKASDVRYGRRGGRYTPFAGGIEKALDEIHALRLRKVAAGEWPEESLVVWRELARQAREHVAAGRPIDGKLARALEVVDAEKARR